MTTIYAALQNALTGLNVNQRSIDVTSQNITNVHTEGYTRKTVEQSSIVLGGFGAGVQIDGLTRNINDFILAEQRTALSEVGTIEAVDAFYQRMQDLFGSPDSNIHVGALIVDLAETMQAFAATPEELSLQIEAVSRAELVALQFTELARRIQDFRHEVDKTIAGAVETINGNLQEIADLNNIIAESEFMKSDVADLQDKRDIAINEIAKLMEITVFPRDNGELVLITKSGRRLVDRTIQTMSHVAPSTFDPSLVYDGPGSNIDGIDLGATDITNEIGNGEIAGLIDLRDNILPDLHTQLLELANTLHEEINAMHNKGVSYPGYATMTGTKSFAAGDAPAWSGLVQVGILDASGVVVETQQFDLGLMANVGAFVGALNGMANLTAAINPTTGQVELTAAGGLKIAINELDSAVTVGARTMGASHFLGLNDLFVGSNSYTEYLSEQQVSRTAALGVAGTLTVAGVPVAYAAGDSLNDIAASISAAVPALTTTVLRDGSGYRLQIADATGANFFVSDAGALASQIGLTAREAGLIATIAVNPQVVTNPARISHATFNAAALVGEIGLTDGDNTAAQATADRFNTKLQFQALGLLSEKVSSIQEYGAAILALNSSQAEGEADLLRARNLNLQGIRDRISQSAGVNLDEEMANLVVLENSYGAAARVVTVASDLLDMLFELVR